MTDKEKALIIIDLIEKITQEIIDKPMQRKKYLQMRGHLEKAVKLTGNGIKREWSRPPSLPLVSHVKAEPVPFKPSTTDNNLDVLADNIPVVTKKARRK
jgi:hypothetical protein